MTGSAFWGALTGSAAYGLGEDTLRPLGAPAAGVGFVLHHVSNTMLGRRLMFFFDGAMRLQCDAEMGRLLAFSVLGPSGERRCSHAFGDRDDALATERTVAVLEQSLAGLCESAAEISVQFDQLGAVREAAQAGLPVDRLLSRLGATDGPVDAEARLRTFFERTRHVMSAAAVFQGDTIRTLKGSEADVEDLRRFSGDLSRTVDAAEGASGSSSRWRLLIVAAEDQAQDEYLVAEHDDQTFMARTGRQDMPALLIAWLDCMRSRVRHG